MAVIEEDVERMRGEVAEVADTQFFQAADQGLAIGAGPGGKMVSLIFIAPGKGVESKSDQG